MFGKYISGALSNDFTCRRTLAPGRKIASAFNIETVRDYFFLFLSGIRIKTDARRFLILERFTVRAQYARISDATVWLLRHLLYAGDTRK